jgi:2-polyprenyl-3-methyl-5-hydroxy-6-metoxy-1,4-benzoquinol methylase
MKCRICKNTKSLLLTSLDHCVYSDGKRAPGIKLMFCDKCRCYSKNIDAKWLKNVSNNYQSNYEPSQVIKHDNSPYLARVLDVLEFIDQNANYKSDKCLKILDYGIGNGEFVNYALQKYPLSSFFGYDAYRHPGLDKLENTERFIFDSSSQRALGRKYNLITMIQVLEHITDCSRVLNELLNCLSDEGYLLIQIPCPYLNPIDLVIYDHASHFSPSGCLHLLKSTKVDSNHITFNTKKSNIKELLLAIHKTDSSSPIRKSKFNEILVEYKNPLDSLMDFKKRIRALRGISNKYIFGTSYSSKWTQNELQDGTSLCDTLSMPKLECNTVIIMPFPWQQAERIAKAHHIQNYICI